MIADGKIKQKQWRYGESGCRETIVSSWTLNQHYDCGFVPEDESCETIFAAAICLILAHNIYVQLLTRLELP